jgi:hypothetical protein
MGRHEVAVVISHITYAWTMMFDHSRFSWGALHRKHVYTGLFIRPSAISAPCGTVAWIVTPKGSRPTEGETLPVSVLPYRCSICTPLVTRQISNFGKVQDTDRLLIPCPRQVSSRLPPSGETCKYATAPSTTKNLERFSVY